MITLFSKLFVELVWTDTVSTTYVPEKKSKCMKLETCKDAGEGMGFFCISLESSSLAIPSMCSSTKEKQQKNRGL